MTQKENVDSHITFNIVMSLAKILILWRNCKRKREKYWKGRGK